MTKIDIFSGFLGAGKTTLIKKLIKEAYSGEKLVLIENEFGEIGIDGGFLKEAGIEVTEMNSGCICCSLVGDFNEALKKVLDEYHPDRILIEPSGVGKLSDVKKAVLNINSKDIVLNSFTTVVDANKCKMYMKNFGEFFKDQVENAKCVILSHSDKSTDAKIADCISLIKACNDKAVIIATPYDKLTGNQITDAMERENPLDEEIKMMMNEEACPVCGHHHEHEHSDCECHSHHHDELHHETSHAKEACEHHHHEHDCGCHDHKHEHHEAHHADEVFSSWGKETANKYTKEQLKEILQKLDEHDEYGDILRAKGIVEDISGEWIYFDYIPGEINIRNGNPDIIGRVCVIGSHIEKEKIAGLFEI